MRSDTCKCITYGILCNVTGSGASREFMQQCYFKSNGQL